VLAADPLIKWDGGWAEDKVSQSDPRYYIYANCPSHKKAKRAAGANEVFADGSAAWRSADRYTFYHFTQWNGAYSTAQEVYWSQDITDFDPTLTPFLSLIKLVQ
jgi:hypothetical protein